MKHYDAKHQIPETQLKIKNKLGSLDIAVIVLLLLILLFFILQGLRAFDINIPGFSSNELQAVNKNEPSFSSQNANPSSQENLLVPSSNAGGGASSILQTEKKPIKVEGNTIIVNDDNFVSTVEQLENAPDKYIGEKIEITGFVYKEEEFSKYQFVIARFMMDGSPDDMDVIGLMCSYDKAEEYKNDSWVKIKGVLKKDNYKGELMDVVSVETIENIKPPENQYVYP